MQEVEDADAGEGLCDDVGEDGVCGGGAEGGEAGGDVEEVGGGVEDDEGVGRAEVVGVPEEQPGCQEGKRVSRLFKENACDANSAPTFPERE